MIKTDDIMTFEETCKFFEIDHIHDGDPSDTIQVCAGEWRREYRKNGDIWRFWSDPEFTA